MSWCGVVTQPDIIAEMADFFVRFDQVNWALAVGLFENLLKLSVRVGQLGGHSGEVLREVVDGLGTAGGHDKRAGGAIPLTDTRPETIDALLPDDPPPPPRPARDRRAAGPPAARSQPRHPGPVSRRSPAACTARSRPRAPDVDDRRSTPIALVRGPGLG